MKELSEAVKKKVEASVRSYPARWTGGVCAFEIFRKDGRDLDQAWWSSPNNGACHAGITSVDKPCIVVNGHKATWKKENPEFLLWCVRESPFSHGVINRENEDEILNHASVFDTEIIGKGGALWVCKAIRHFREDTWKLKTWNQLREYGLNGFQAFIGADILGPDGKPSGRTHVGLFGYNSPTKLREVYDEIRGLDKITTNHAAREGKWDTPLWGSLAGKKEKKADGWGGYIEIDVPCDAKEYAAKLKEIFEGDPKNVG